MLALGGGRPADQVASLFQHQFLQYSGPGSLQRNGKEASLKWQKVNNMEIKCTKSIPLLPLQLFLQFTKTLNVLVWMQAEMPTSFNCALSLNCSLLPFSPLREFFFGLVFKICPFGNSNLHGLYLWSHQTHVPQFLCASYMNLSFVSLGHKGCEGLGTAVI